MNLNFTNYLEQEKAAALAAAEGLTRDSRRDEGDLMRVRANIFDVFAAVCRAAQNREDPAAFVREKLEHIPRAWHAALAAAEEHGDHRNVIVERVKLDTAAEIGKALTDREGAAE